MGLAMTQILLFPDPCPLVERLGRNFFRQLPERPGVYLMRGASDALLYVGKAKNLRKRLGSYRVANPDRMPRRHLRLLRAVERIEIQECQDERSALEREAQLLRTLRPRFNRAGTWSAPPKFLAWKLTEEKLQLAVTAMPEADWRSLGPMGAGARHLRTAMVRLLRKHCLDGFPLRIPSFQPENFSAFRRNHGLMPRGVPNNFHRRVCHPRQVKQFLLSVSGNDRAHSTTGRCQCHFHQHFALAAGQRFDAHVIDQSEINDVHRYLRIKAAFQRVPNQLLIQRPRRNGRLQGNFLHQTGRRPDPQRVSIPGRDAIQSAAGLDGIISAQSLRYLDGRAGRQCHGRAQRNLHGLAIAL